MNDRETVESLGDRRDFLRKAILGAGVALAAPAILSVVRPSDLSAQASGGFVPSGVGNGRGRGPGNGQGGPPISPPGLNR
jgi:hypothetical protein